MAEGLSYLLQNPETVAGTYWWEGSEMKPPRQPHEWDWRECPVPFGPIKDHDRLS